MASDLKTRARRRRHGLRLDTRTWLILLSCAVLAVSLPIFGWLKTRASAPVPQPSVPGGYYDGDFTLYLNAPPYGKIYYTTDGSEPSEASQCYQNGIPITDRSAQPNVYHSIRNVIRDWQTFTPDTEPVKKGTVIRAIYVSDWGSRSEILTQTYFVGFQPPARGYTLSLVFDDDAMFGENGIHVTGKAYDEWYLSGGTGTAPEPNYMSHREIGVIAELLESTGDVMNQPVGLRIQGVSSRERRDKRFILTARKEYSGSPVFDTVLYDGVLTHSVMLKYSISEAIVKDLFSDRAATIQRSIPVQVYLNGEYWYDCFMLERYDKQFFNQYYQVENRVLVKQGIVQDHPDFDAEQYDYSAFMRWVGSADFSDPAQWAAFQEQADVQSCIDYFAINYLLCNLDISDRQNYVLWRAPSLGGRQTELAKWKWCIYDVDALEWTDAGKYGPLEAINTFSSDEGRGIGAMSVFRALKENPEFCRQFATSFMDILNNNFVPERVGRVLERYGCDLNFLDGYFQKRPAYAARQLAQELNLTGSLETVSIHAEHPEMGKIIVNTSQIDLSTGWWTGQYYSDYPITVTAQAEDGYEFVGWKGDADTAESSLSLSVDGGLALEAVFAQKP